MKTNYDNHVGPGRIATVITLPRQLCLRRPLPSSTLRLTPTPMPPSTDVDVNTDRRLSYYPNASCQHTPTSTPLLSLSPRPFPCSEAPPRSTGLALSRQTAASPTLAPTCSFSQHVCVTSLTCSLRHPPQLLHRGSLNIFSFALSSAFGQ